MSLNRIGALILVIFFLTPLAFRGASVRTPSPVRLGTAEGNAALRRRADDYLRQTRRLLGNRFQEEFYRSAVETRLAGFSAAAEAPRSVERRCFDFLSADSDPCADEVFAFLDEVERETPALPDDVPYLAGNPINAYAARLAFSPPPAIRGDVPRRGFQASPLSFRAGSALSLLTLLASIFSAAPPIGGAAGWGVPSFREFFQSMARRPCSVSLFTHGRVIRRGASAFFPRLKSLEEKKSVCLLR